MAHPTSEAAERGYKLLIERLRDYTPTAPAPFLAAHLGVERNRCYHWRQIPAAHLVEACKLAEMPPWQVRPDLFSKREFMELARMEETE